MLYFRKYLTNSLKHFFWLKDDGRLLYVWKISSAQIFGFCNGNVTTFPTSRKCKNFNSSRYTVPAEMLYLHKYLTNFQKLSFVLQDEEGWLLWLKISRAQIFWFCNGNVTTFPTSRKCKNFNFSLYTVPAEMLYFRKYLTNSPKTFLAERWWRWLLWLKISRAQIFWFCNGKITTFPTSRKCKNFNSSLYTVPAEMLYFRKYLTNSQKTFFGWKMMKVAIVAENFKGSACFGFTMATLQLFQHPENVKISILPFTQSQQKCYIFESI